jgi:uncharacterized protein (DUF433 family)
MGTPTPRTWHHLEPRPGSGYRQLFVKGRRIKATDLHDWYVGEGEPKMTAADLAADFGLPIEAVEEAIAYCESNPPEVEEDYQREQATAEAMGMNDPDYKWNPRPRPLTPEDRARIDRT